MYLSAVLACLLALGTAWTPQPIAHAAGDKELKQLVITDQNGQEAELIYLGNPMAFDPATDSYTLYYYHDTVTYTISAVAENSSYQVAIFAGPDMLVEETGAAEAQIDVREASGKIIGIRISDGSASLKTYGMYLLPGMRGRGTAEEPYQIASAEQFALINAGGDFTAFKHYELVDDIDMSDYLDGPGNNSGKGWNPLSLNDTTFDGNGHTISGLWINNPSGYAGLFYTLMNTTVSDLNLVLDEDIGIIGRDYAGGLAYSLSGGTIENVTVTGSIKANRTAGGFVASATGGQNTITNSTFEGTVEVLSSGGSAGGIAGQLVGTMNDVSAIADVTGYDEVGGLIGSLYSGSITGNHAKGTVSGLEKVGGLIGSTSSSNTIENNVAEVDVEGTNMVGGFVGYASSGKFVTNVAYGNVTGQNNVGGFLGQAIYGGDPFLHQAAAYGDVSGSERVGGLAGNVGFTANITESYSFANVTASGNGPNASAGGLIGEYGNGTVSDSFAAGKVNGTDKVGGLIGKVLYINLNVTNAYAAGEVAGSTDVGGFIGGFNNQYSQALLSGSFWDTEASGQDLGIGSAHDVESGLDGLGTDLMKSAATFEEAEWDSGIWLLKDGMYPLLKWYLIQFPEPPQGIGLDEDEVEENAEVGTTVGTLSVVNAQEGITYTFTLTDAETTPDNAYFQIDGNTLKTNAVFDYETKNEYHINVQAADHKGQTAEQSFTIKVKDVNDAPTGLTLSSTTVEENAEPGTVVGTLEGTDPDEGDVLTYSLVAGEGDDDNGDFAVSGNQLLTAKKFDYETKNEYRIRVSVTDSVYSFEKSFRIVIKDLPENPGEIMLSSSEIAENEPEGTVVGQLSAESYYEHSDVLFALVSGEGDDDNGDFLIEGNVLKTAAKFDYESGSTLKIRVSVVDSVYGAEYSNEKSFVISVLDINEAPTVLSLDNRTVEEGKPAGTIVGKFTGTDPDEGAVLVYALASGDGDDDNNLFRIDGDLLKTDAVLDYDVKSEYCIRAAVSDGEFTYEASFVIEVTPKEPGPGDGGDSGEDDDAGGSGPSIDGGTSPNNRNHVDVIVNGDRENRLAVGTVIEDDGRTIIVVELDEEAVLNRLAQEGQGTVLSVDASGALEADGVTGRLNGEIVKQMENKDAVLVIQTETVRYTLPAAYLNIDEISSRFENASSLANIHITFEVAAAAPDQILLLQETAEQESFVPVMMPVNFTVRAEFAGRTIEVQKFNAYVEREITLPEGADPTKVTTGVIVHEDGTVTHVPTYIEIRGNRYVVKLNSLTNSAYAVIYHPRTFADAEGHWAKRWINEMASRKVVEGKTELRFLPDDPVTRAEFAAMLVRGLGLSDKADLGAAGLYADVRSADWHFGAVMKASEYGLVKGYDDGTFRPDELITREQAMTIIHRAMAVAGVDAYGENAMDSLAQHPDGSMVSDWAKSAAAAVVEAGIFHGSPEGLQPQAAMTRAEAAVVLHRLLTAAQLINPLQP